MNYIVAGLLNNTVKNLLKSDTNELRLSFDNFVKNQAKHPEITYQMYKNAVNYINNPFAQFPKGNQIISFYKKENTIYQIVLKTTKNKLENYLQSFRVGDYNDILKLQKQ